MEYIGEFVTPSKKIIISDPCYDKPSLNSLKSSTLKSIFNPDLTCIQEHYDVDQTKSVFNVNYEKWFSYVEKDHRTISKLGIYKEPNIINTEKFKHSTCMCVDSGQMCMWDFDSFSNNNSLSKEEIDSLNSFSYMLEHEIWYRLCCKLSISEGRAGVSKYGVISSSGYGDGFYPLYILKESDDIVGFEIDFFKDELEDVFDDDEDDELICEGNEDDNGVLYEDDFCVECGYLSSDCVCLEKEYQNVENILEDESSFSHTSSVPYEDNSSSSFDSNSCNSGGGGDD